MLTYKKANLKRKPTKISWLLYPIMGIVLTCSAGFCEESSNISSASKTVHDDLAVSEPAIDPASVVAKVDGQLVTRQDLNWEIDSLLMGMGGQSFPPEVIEQIRPQMEPQALDTIILKLQLQKYAEANAITVSDASIENEMTQIKSQFEDEQAIQQFLLDRGLTMDSLEQNIRRDLVWASAIQDYTDNIPPPSQLEMETYYQENTEAFAVVEKVVASHILIATSTEDATGEDVKKLKLTQELRDKIVAGADFAELAKEHSSCPSSAKGGSLGEFGKGQMVPAFEEAAFALKTGEVSEVVQSPFGYHLIQVSDHKEAGTISFELANEKVEQILKDKSMEKWYDNLVRQAIVERP